MYLVYFNGGGGGPDGSGSREDKDYGSLGPEWNEARRGGVSNLIVSIGPRL